MNRSICYLSFLILAFICIMQMGAAETVLAVSPDAEEAISKARETISILANGIVEADKTLQKIKDNGTDNEYRVAKEIKEEAERMHAAAVNHRADSIGMADIYPSVGTTNVANAVSYTSRAEADTARTYARIGLLFLKALQFAADKELDCAEETNDALRDKQRTWRTMKKIVALADASLEHANSAMGTRESAADEAEKSTVAAKKCIALARELNLLLENFEDICNDFIKDWQEFKDEDDDEKPSPV